MKCMSGSFMIYPKSTGTQYLTETYVGFPSLRKYKLIELIKSLGNDFHGKSA